MTSDSTTPSRLQQIFPAGSLRARFAVGASWTLGGTLALQALQLAASFVVARWLGQAGYGELGIIISTIGMFGAFGGLGVGMTATKYVAELRAQSPERAGHVIALCMEVAVAAGLLGAVVLFLLSPLLASRVLNAPHIVFQLRLACALLLLNTLIGVQGGALTGFEAFDSLAKVNIVRGLINLPFVILGSIYFGLSGAVGGTILGATGGWLAGKRALDRACSRSSVEVRYWGAGKERSVVWGFSVPMFLSYVLAFPALWLASALLVNRPNGYNEMGIFTAANQWRLGIVFIPGITNQVLLPILSNLYGTNDIGRFKKMLFANIGLVGGISLLACVPIAVLAHPIMTAYGPGFVRGGMVLVALVFSGVLSGTASVVGSAIASLGKMWSGFLLNMIWTGAFLLLAFLWIRHGAVGLANAYLASYLLHAVATTIYVLMVMPKVFSLSGHVLQEPPDPESLAL